MRVFCARSLSSRRSSAQRTGSSSQRGRSGSSRRAASTAVARSQPRFTSTIRSLSGPMISRTSASRSMSSPSGALPALALNPGGPCAFRLCISDPPHALAERRPARLGLEPGVPLRFQHLHLIAQLRRRLAVAVVGTGHEAGDLAAIAAEQAVQRQLGHLSDQVPARYVDRRGNADDRLARPALLARTPLPGQRKELLVALLRRERVHPEALFADLAAANERE